MLASTRISSRWLLRTGLFCALLSNHCAGQVTTTITSDGSLGTSVNQAGPAIDISGGTTNGDNLFHSFGRFEVGTGDVATFNGPGGIQNIIGRVTGGVLSAVDGQIASGIAGANVFLLNPAGFWFGPNAIINIDGGFHVSSADYLRFADGATWFVDPGTSSSLSVAAVSAFGFIDSTVGAITIETPTVSDPLSPRVGTPGFMMAPGAALSIVGGDLTIGAPDGSLPSYLLAPLGSIRLASVASAGELRLLPAGRVDVADFVALGALTVQGGSFIDAPRVILRAGDLTLRDAMVLPGAFSLFGLDDPPDGGVVDLAASRTIDISGTGPDPLFGAPPGVLVFAGLDPLAPNAQVPDVVLNAPFIRMRGTAGITTNRLANGAANTVTLRATNLEVTDGAAVSLINVNPGDGGLLRIEAQSVLLDAGDSTQFTGFAAQSFLNPNYTVAFDPALASAPSGRIEIEATGSLTLRNGAEITTDARSFGASGAIRISAGQLELVDSRILAQSSFAGDSGDVTITTSGSVSITEGGIISAATFGGGDGGAVRITANGGLTITGEASGIASQTTPLPESELNAFAEFLLGPGATLPDVAGALGLAPDADIFAVLQAMNDFGLAAIPADELTPGDGGAIHVNASTLSLSGKDAAIDSSTAWDGHAGEVTLQTGSAFIGAGATVGSRSGIPNLATGELFVGTGRAGNVNVSATGLVEISGAGATLSTDTRGSGDAGNVGLRAFELRVTDSGKISSSSTGTGLAGNIDIQLGDSLSLNHGTIATEALTSDGGNIAIRAPRLVDLLNGQITTSVGSGQGNGGNIFIDPEFVVLQSSQIIANAFGGAGGNIDIIAGFLLVSPDSLIDASSALGVDGIVRTTAPDTDVSASLAVLPASYLDAASQLPAQCGAARAGFSSLTQVGRGGVPRAPSDYLLGVYPSSSNLAAIDTLTPTLALSCVQ